MKKIKLIITFTIFTLAISGVVVAKESEKKRALQTNAYFLDIDGITWVCVTLAVVAFQSQGTCTQASIKLCNNGTATLYLSQSTNSPAAYIHP